MTLLYHRFENYFQASHKLARLEKYLPLQQIYFQNFEDNVKPPSDSHDSQSENLCTPQYIIIIYI